MIAVATLAGAASRLKASWQQMSIVKEVLKGTTGLCKGPYETLERYVSKDTCTVLRGGGDGNAASLPDPPVGLYVTKVRKENRYVCSIYLQANNQCPSQFQGNLHFAPRFNRFASIREIHSTANTRTDLADTGTSRSGA